MEAAWQPNFMLRSACISDHTITLQDDEMKTYNETYEYYLNK